MCLTNTEVKNLLGMALICGEILPYGQNDMVFHCRFAVRSMSLIVMLNKVKHLAVPVRHDGQ